MGKKNLTKELGLDNNYKNVDINDKTYVFRIPSALEQMELEDNNFNAVTGEVDQYGYIKDILKFVSPHLSMKDIVKKISTKIKLSEIELTFDKLKVEDAFKIILGTVKSGVNSEGVEIAKPNQVATLKSIIKASKEKPDINTLSKEDLKVLLSKFQEIYDAQGAMTLYTTFQKNI